MPYGCKKTKRIPARFVDKNVATATREPRGPGFRPTSEQTQLVGVETQHLIHGQKDGIDVRLAHFANLRNVRSCAANVRS